MAMNSSLASSLARARGVADNTEAFHNSVVAKAEKAATARERREAQRQPVRAEAAPAAERSDLADLLEPYQKVNAETREEKSLTVTGRDGKTHFSLEFSARPLPRELSEQVDNAPGPMGVELRRAREEGRMRFDMKRGRWLVDGIQAPAQSAKSEAGHFTSAMFRNTARRYNRERGEGIR